ncbi:MAG: DUF2934 domain-containing protein [Myxococcota bacterium]|jgi:hypothetical protein|nr:DUF2934 domain-containing protein [Myxococcota bacterium]
MATAKTTPPKSAADPAGQGNKSSSTPRAAKTPSRSAADRPDRMSRETAAAKPRRSRKSEPATVSRLEASPSSAGSTAAESAKSTAAESTAAESAESTAAESAESTAESTAAEAPTARFAVTGHAAPSLDVHLETEREARLRKHAYLLAESNHFAGDPSFYWHVAERELERSEPFDAPSTPRHRSAPAETH